MKETNIDNATQEVAKKPRKAKFNHKKQPNAAQGDARKKSKHTDVAQKVSSEESRKAHVRVNRGAVKLSFLGGIGEIGKNMLTLEYGNDMIVIDSGLAFPDEDMPGVDVVIPDITYLIENKDKIRGIFITHGHEDHIGALPYVLADINAPVYGSKFTIALIESKLREHRGVKMKSVIVKPHQVVRAGCFKVEFLNVTHSMPGSMAFAVTTPAGVYFHTGDFKLDLSPIDGQAMDLVRMGELARDGVLLLTADSTNAERLGFSMGERDVGVTLDGIFSQNRNKRIIVTTFASNVYRVQQILDISEKYGRKVAFTGRSMLNICDAAVKAGELVYNKSNLIDIDNIDKYPDSELCILTTGSQGQPASALARMAVGEFKKVEIGKNDLIIFSSSSIPGNEKMINDVINMLYRRGAEVIYESLARVHVSGHAYRDELKVVHSLLRPKFFMPVHGEYRHLRAHANLAMSLGMEERNIIIPELGDQVELTKNSMKVARQIPFGAKLVDGLGVGDVSDMVIRDRIQLSEEGICVVIVSINKLTGALAAKPDMVCRGFTFAKDDNEKVEEARDVVIAAISQANFKTQDWGLIKQNIRKALSSYFMKKIKRKPVIMPIILER